MLKIRLQRVGRVNNPSFRLVLTDSKNATKSGKYVEVLGHYDFRGNTADMHIEGDKIKYWISKGAKPTPTVHNLLLEQKVITGKKINVLPRKSPPKPKVEEAAKGAAAGAAKADAATPATGAAASAAPAAEAKAEAKAEAPATDAK